MPILIAIAVATIVVTGVLTLVARRGPSSDPADIRTSSDGLVEQSERHPALRRFLVERRDATKVTGLLLTVALVLIAVLTLVVGLLLEMVQTHQGFARRSTQARQSAAIP